MSSNAAEVGEAGVIVLFGTVFSMLSGFLFRILLAQHTETEIFGTVILFLSMLNIVSIVCLLGQNRGVVKFISERNQTTSEKNSYVSSAIIISTVASVLIGFLIVTFGDVAQRTLFDRSVSDLFIYIFAAALPFYTVNQLLGSSLHGNMNSTGYVLFSKVVQPVLKLSLTLAVVFLVGSVWTITAALVVGFVLSSVWGFWLIAREGWRPTFDTSIDLSAFLLYSLPLMMASSVYILLTNFDKLMIAYYTSPVQVGQYEVAMTLAQLLGFFNSGFSFLVLPKVSSLISSGNREEIEPLYQQTTKWILLFTTPLFLILLFRPNVFISLFGAEYQSVEVTSALSLLAVGFYTNAILGPNSETLLGLGRSWTVLGYNALAVVVNVVLNVLLIPRFGLMGAAAASLAGYSLMNVCKSADLFVVHNVTSINRKSLEMTVAGSLVGLLFVRLLPPTSSLLLEVLAVGVIMTASISGGLSVLYRTNGIGQADKELLQRLVSYLP